MLSIIVKAAADAKMSVPIKNKPGALEPPGEGWAHAALNLEWQAEHRIDFCRLSVHRQAKCHILY